MQTQLKRNMLICQSGGPTAVINQSLVGAIREARKQKKIGRIYGSMHSIQGILNEDFIDLGRESLRTIDLVAQTPSSALGTVRTKPTPEQCLQMFDVMKRNDVGYFFMIGGNDSAENTFIISARAKLEKARLHCFHIPKTIDNDLMENDHTPGFGSAAKFVACAFMGDNLDNRALPGVKINIVMGRHAGFLTAASAIGREFSDDGPHLIYLPERSFSMTRFVKDVKRVYANHGRCVIAVSEGISDSKGIPIAAKFTKEVDSHGNVQLSGTGALGDLLAAELKKRTGISRVRTDTFGYLQRSFPGIVSERDASEAHRVGILAVREAISGRRDGSISIRRKPGKKYQIYYKCVPLKKVARKTKHMPAKFINSAGNNITDAFLAYAKPIVGKLPSIGRFRAEQTNTLL